MNGEQFANDVVSRLRRAYEPAADPVRAAGEFAYMRGQFQFLGMTTGERRRLMKQALLGLPAPAEHQLAAVARALWREPEREFQHTGCDYLRAHIGVAGPAFLDVLHELVTTKSWWDTVDGLAAHAVGPLVRNDHELVLVMDRWIESDDFWVARTVLLHQLTYKQHTDQDRLFRYCRRRAGNREFFIRKAIGWALRSYAAVAPDAVAAFVRVTPELSPLSVREATKGVLRARGRTP